MMQTSEQITEIAAALAKAQGEVKGAIKDATNPHFRSSYADLASVWDACREALTGNGLSVVQAPGSGDDGSVCVTTRLLHASGQWMETAICCRPAKNDAQGLGSVITYLRRYSLAAMVGVAPEDDDGEGASGRGKGGQELGEITPRTSTSPQDRRTKDADWHDGPAKNVTALKDAMRRFRDDVDACDDLDSIDALTASHQALLTQCEKNLPSWWFGDGGDIKGAKAHIDTMRDLLAQREGDHQSFAA